MASKGRKFRKVLLPRKIILEMKVHDASAAGNSYPGSSLYNWITVSFSGLVQVIRPDGTYRSQQRFGLYRWHIADPIRFEKELKVTIQDLGWRHGGRYLPQQSDIASVCFWYQTLPHVAFPKLPDWRGLEVN